jgi:hypothetical protein
VEIVETARVGGKVRGRLLEANAAILPEALEGPEAISEEAWITIQITGSDHQVVLAEPVPLGAYVIDVEPGTAVTGVKNFTKDSPQLDHLCKGRYVDIVQTGWMQEGCRVRGRLANGNWLTIRGIGRQLIPPVDENDKNDNQVENDYQIVADPVVLGWYLIVWREGVSLCPSKEELSGEPGEHLAHGSFVEIVETRWLEDLERLRGKCADGRWITLEKCPIEENFVYIRAWSVPEPLEQYRAEYEKLSKFNSAAADDAENPEIIMMA